MRFRRRNSILSKHIKIGSLFVDYTCLPPGPLLPTLYCPLSEALIPEGCGQKPKQVLCTPQCLTQTPQMLKKNILSLSFLAPSSSTSYGQSLQRGQCFFLLFDRHSLNNYPVPSSMGNAVSGYKVTLTELLLYTRHCTKHFSCINPFNSQNNSMEYAILILYKKKWKHRE